MKENNQDPLEIKQKNNQSDQNSSDSKSSESEQQIDENGYDASFVNDDDEEDDEDYYGRPHPDFHSRDEFRKKQKKHKKQKQKTYNRIKRLGQEDDLDDEDLLLVQDFEHKHKKLKRLKKKEQKPMDEQHSQSYKENSQGYADQQELAEQDFADNFNYQQQQQQQSLMNEIFDYEKNINDIFEPEDLNQMYIEPDDQEIVDFDMPERQLLHLKNLAKVYGKSIEQTRKQFENDEKKPEAVWIFQKLRSQLHLQTYDNKFYIEKILNVLHMIHKEHLQIMYIYYYRKKQYADVLNLEILWKIQELDQEWSSFKEQYKKTKEQLVTVLSSYQQTPKGLLNMLNNTTEIRTFKYFKQYEDFIESKYNAKFEQKKKRSSKFNLISQVKGKGVAQWLQKKNIFLSPQDICSNLNDKTQNKRPNTPKNTPNVQLQRFFKQNESEDDKTLYPLLSVQKNRIQTILTYLQLELFNYPELRKILKQKYYRRLVISTTPTKKGQQDINLYSMYFPVKRIREKPISSLKKQVWIMATEAQKLGFIRIQLKFQWQLAGGQVKNFQGDSIYLEIIKYYFDVNAEQHGDIWNLFRKQVITKLLQNYFFPAFYKQVRDDLTRQGHKQIINIACNKFRQQLNKGPSLIDGKPKKILSMVLQNQKLGMAFVDQWGQAHSQATLTLNNDEDLRRFVHDEIIYNYIEEHKPQLILIAANCRRAQTLRKQLRTQNLFSQTIFVDFGQYQVASLMAKKQLIKGITDERVKLEAISMARIMQNPMAEILGLWSDKIEQNGVLQMNFHPLQKALDARKLKDSLQKVAIEVVNLVGLNINLIKSHHHLQNQLQFVCGLGPRKAFEFLSLLKQNGQIKSRLQILNCLKDCSIVYKNCSPFFKIESLIAQQLKQVKDNKKKKRGQQFDILDQEQIYILDGTRIPTEWYKLTEKLALQAIGMINLIASKNKKENYGLKDEAIALAEVFKHPQKLRGIELDRSSQQYTTTFFDEELVKSQITNRFKNPRQPQKKMENRQIFYHLLKQTPQTLKRYMIFTVKIVSVNPNSLNVVISENGLFGYIKIHQVRKQYEKGNYIKALILGFPFDEKKYREKPQQDQQLLKVQMGLSFPHKTQERNHDCFSICFPSIVKQIHPLIDLDKERFDLRKEDKPIIEVKQETRARPQYRRISHPKFKNVNCVQAIQILKSESIGDFLIRPSSEGAQFLVITWHFYKNIVAHIKVKSQSKSVTNPNLTYRIIDRDKDKSYSTLDQMIDKYLKPMNNLVQDVISNKKFIALNIDQVQEKVKNQMNRDNTHIHYFFCVHEEYPTFFVLVYIYRDKKAIKQLVKVKNTGLFFHDQQFSNTRDLIVWFKEHLKDKEYQRYARNTAIKK